MREAIWALVVGRSAQASRGVVRHPHTTDRSNSPWSRGDHQASERTSVKAMCGAGVAPITRAIQTKASHRSSSPSHSPSPGEQWVPLRMPRASSSRIAVSVLCERSVSAAVVKPAKVRLIKTAAMILGDPAVTVGLPIVSNPRQSIPLAVFPTLHNKPVFWPMPTALIRGMLEERVGFLHSGRDTDQPTELSEPLPHFGAADS